MLDKLREGSQGVAAKAVLVVIILSFALAGVGSYLGGSSASVAVVVNDQEISAGSIEQAYQNERNRYQQQYGEQFDMLASNPNFAQQVRAQATQGLISKTLLTQAIAEMGLRVGDEQVKDEIRQMDAFQVDGKFNNEQYLAMLRRASYSPSQFSQSVKEDLVRNQLLQMLMGSEFVLPSEVNTVQQLQSQQRIAKVLMINSAEFANADTVTDEQINTYYQENSEKFKTAEQVSVDYILLDASTLSDQVSVTDADVEAAYDTNSSEYQRAERRKLAHILIQGVAEESKQKAQAILAEINAGADFGALAAEKSDDKHSGANQGELDWLELGVMGGAFDDAAFALSNEAPVSELVKTDFGYHIIKLLDIEASETLPFEKVKARIKVTLQKEKAVELYYELHQTLSEVAFESPDSLDEAASAIDAQVQHSELFTAAKAPRDLTNSSLLQTVFDQNFRDEGMNSELIELDDNKAIVVRVNEHKEASVKPLSEVSERVKTDLTNQNAQQLAKQFAESVTTKLDNNESIDAELTEKNFAFSADVTFARSTREFDHKVIQAVFKLAKPTEGQLSRQWVELSNGNFAVVELSEVVDVVTEDEKVVEQLESMLTRSSSDATYQALIAHLTAIADIRYPVAD